MNIPTKLTIYVPDDASSQSIALRAGLRAVVLIICVGPRESFPSGTAWSKAGRAFFEAHPGLLGVLTWGGTAVLRAVSSLGDHDLRVHLPDGIDYDHIQETPAESGVAEVQVRRGGHWERGPASGFRVFPPPMYNVGAKRYEEA
jgi:hypothetical protein